MHRCLCLLLFVCWAGNAEAQRLTDHNTHLWVTYLGDYRIIGRWGLHIEAHGRRAHVGQHWQQLLLRPAVNYHLNDRILFSLGYSYYITYSYGDYPLRYATPEHHLYQQVQWKESHGRLGVQQRYRLEQRYVAAMLPDADGTGYIDHYRYYNRFRYRLLLTLPLSHANMDKQVWFASVYDELFLTFGDAGRTDGIQQNRLSALLGYQLDVLGSSIQLGYLLQSINRPDLNLQEMNSTLHLMITYNLDFRRIHP